MASWAKSTKAARWGPACPQSTCTAPAPWSRLIPLSTNSLQSVNHKLDRNPSFSLCTCFGKLIIFYHRLEEYGDILPTLSVRPSPPCLAQSCQKTAAPLTSFLAPWLKIPSSKQMATGSVRDQRMSVKQTACSSQTKPLLLLH